MNDKSKSENEVSVVDDSNSYEAPSECGMPGMIWEGDGVLHEVRVTIIIRDKELAEQYKACWPGTIDHLANDIIRNLKRWIEQGRAEIAYYTR